MDTNLLRTFQYCERIHEIKKEFDTPFGRFKFKKKKVYKELVDKLKEVIHGLYDIPWTIDYLYKTEQTLIFYKDHLRDYFDTFYIDEDAFQDNYDPSKFYTMYFEDVSKNRIITLDIIADNINFVIMDTESGNSFSATSAFEISESQNKIENACKHIFVTFMEDFLYETPSINYLFHRGDYNEN